MRRSIRPVINLLLICGLLSAAGMVLAKSQIDRAAAGRIFSKIEEVPARKTALVLGCRRTLPNGRQNLYFQHRIQAAAELFKSGKAQYLLVSGDNSRKTYDETTDMFKALIEQGIPAERIVQDYAGFSTLDSVVRARQIFLEDRIIVVSQDFHARRAVYIGSAHHMDVVGYAAQDVCGVNSLRTRLRENLARVKTVLDVTVLNRRPRFLGEPIPIGAPEKSLSVPVQPRSPQALRAKMDS